MLKTMPAAAWGVSLLFTSLWAIAADSPPPAPQAAGPNPEPVTLGPVIVTGSPLGRTLFEQAQPISLLDGEKLTLSLEPTLGQTLSNTPGVRSSYFGPASSRPVIRGLDGDRIRVLQNGVNTMDASATSVDHAVSFDPVSVRSIEVVRGPATVLFGANAIGGVVNVNDGRIPDERIEAPVQGSIGSRYTSADDGVAGNLELEGGIGGFAWHLEGYKKELEDLHIPGFARSSRLRALDPLEAGGREERYVVANTYLNSEGWSAGASWIWDSGFFGAAYSGFNTDYGSPAEKEVSIDMEQRRWDFAGAFREPFAGLKEIKYKFAHSDYEHTEFEGPEAGTTFTNEGYDGRVEFTHQKLGPLEGVFGYQIERSDFEAVGEEKFLPRVLTRSHSAFLFEEWRVNDQFTLQGGARYDHISADADSDEAFGPARSRTFNDISGSLGVVYSPNEDWALAFSTSWSERAPTYQELYANGPHVATGAFEIGDADLPVEEALGFDLSLRKRTGRVTGSLTGFYTRFSYYNGLFPTGGERELEEEALPVYAYRGTRAEFFGGEAEAVIHLLEPVEADAAPEVIAGKNPVGKSPVPATAAGTAQPVQSLNLELKADYVRAEDTRTGDPLPRISPFHASAALDYRRGPVGARVEGIYSARQNETADYELPTDSYILLNAALSYEFITGGVTTSLYVKGVNLTDEEAREHTSFLKDIMPLQGRGVVAGVKVAF